MSDPDAELRNRYGPVAAVLGAGQGIGRAFAQGLAARGFELLLVDVDERALEAAQRELEADGARVEAHRLDLASRDAGDALASWARRHEVGLAVYSAARAPVGSFLAAAPAGLREAIAVNCGGALAACHALAGPMVGRGRGGLVLLTSLAGLQGTGTVAAYSATKAFDLALAEALWWELGEQGVDVLALVAGSTDTPGFRGSRPKLASSAVLDPPERVVDEGLAHLAHGPVHVVGEGNRKVARALESMDRADRIRLISEQTRALYPGEDP